MTQTEHEEAASGTAAVTVEPLFIELRTLTIRGKHVKPALLRQFVSEDLIETKGPTLRGRPLAWHTLHEKHCAALPPHIHVLWQKGTIYRVALVPNNKEQDERYSVMLAEIGQRCFDLCDLLALILAQEHRFDPGPITIDGIARDRDRRRELAIGEYTLSLSPNVCYYLRCLEEARRRRDRDALAVPDEGRDGVIKQAHLLLVHLYDQGIVLGHPTLNSDLHDEMILPIPLKSYSADKEDEDGATELLATFAGEDEARRPRVRWNWRRGYRESGDITAIGNQLRTHELALLAAISDLIVQQRLRKVQGAARSLVNVLGVALEAPKEPQKQLEGGITLLPLEAQNVWQLYESEERRLDGYPQAWERLQAQLFALDQIFIDV